MRLTANAIGCGPRHVLLLLLLTWAPAASRAIAADLTVDGSKVIGTIRPLHGANNGPIQCGELLDLSAGFRELGIPLSRLHDCHWPNPDVVDMHAVFPNPAADPSLPASYDFSRTDGFIQAVLDTGSQVVYRLGESIEHSKKKYHVHPPADVNRWAATCVGIVRHYNEGWASGFRHNIRYWEIWNEPENRPAMWTGTDEEFLLLYETTAKALKAHDPKLMVGGPAFGYYGKLTDGRFEPSPFVLAFLERCRSRSVPLDFFSWHLYTDDPSECVARARGLREVLDRHGFKRAELHFNEWNYLPGNDWTPMMREGQGLPRERFYAQMGGPPGAAFDAAVLINLQDAPVDVANFYAADHQGFGLFTTDGVPRKNFYAFKAFRVLLDTPQRLAVQGNRPAQLVACAGVNPARTQLGVLVARVKGGEEEIGLRISSPPWSGPTACEVRLVDAGTDLAVTHQERFPPGQIHLKLPAKPPAVWLVKLTPATE